MAFGARAAGFGDLVLADFIVGARAWRRSRFRGLVTGALVWRYYMLWSLLRQLDCAVLTFRMVTGCSQLGTPPGFLYF